MRFVSVVMVAMVLAACTPGGERDVDRSEVGATATAGAVSITYPAEPGFLALDPSDLAEQWQERIADPFDAPTVNVTAGRADAGSVNDPISLESIVDEGRLVVTQLAVVNGSGEDDEAVSAEIVEAFLGLLVEDVDSAMAGLGFGADGVLFDLSEDGYEVAGLSLYRASNEDTILIGVVRTP